MVEQVFRKGDMFTENVKQKFYMYFPNSRCPNHDTVHDLIHKFCETSQKGLQNKNGIIQTGHHPGIQSEYRKS